jgi:hypothetical protein
MLQRAEQQRRAAEALGLERSGWFAVIFERRKGKGRGHLADSYAEALEVARTCAKALDLRQAPSALPADASVLCAQHGDSWSERVGRAGWLSLVRVYESPSRSPSPGQPLVIVSFGDREPLVPTVLSPADVRPITKGGWRFPRVIECSDGRDRPVVVPPSFKTAGATEAIARLPIVQMANGASSRVPARVPAAPIEPPLAGAA